MKEGTSSVTITFTKGNYTRNSLAINLKNLLNAASPNGYVYAVSFNNIISNYDQGKYLITVTGNGITQPQFIFGLGMAEQLGFNVNTTYTFSSSSLTSPNVCNLSTETTLFINSDICQNTEGNNVLQEIYSNGEPTFAYINFLNPNPHEYSKNLSAKGSNVFYFMLTDEFGTVIDTNGININFTLMVYKRNNIDDLIRGAIKYFDLINSKE